METKTIGKFTITIKDGFTRKELPFYHEWIAALRSGKYPQGKDFLVSTYGEGEKQYCCLGVLSKIQDRLPDIGYRSDGYRGLSPSNPSYAALRACGSIPNCAYVTDSKNMVYRHLAYLNDKGATFNEIADIIEYSWQPVNESLPNKENPPTLCEV